MWQERRSPKRNRHVSELGTLKVIRTGAPFVVDPFNRQYSWRAKRPLLYVTAYGKFPLLGVVTTTTLPPMMTTTTTEAASETAPTTMTTTTMTAPPGSEACTLLQKMHFLLLLLLLVFLT